MSTGTTIAFSHKGGYWKSRYSFAPRCYFYIGNEMYSSPGALSTAASAESIGWKHNSKTSVRNTFYGDYYDSSLTIVSNYNPSQVKVFNAISVESNYGSWKTKLETNVSGGVARLDNDYQQTNINPANWKRKESVSYKSIPRSAKNSYSNIFFVGKMNGSPSLGSSVSIAESSEAFPIGQGSMVVFGNEDGILYAFWRTSTYDTDGGWAKWSPNLVLPAQDLDDAVWPFHSPGVVISSYSATDGNHQITLEVADDIGDPASLEDAFAGVDFNEFKYLYIASDPRINGDQMRGNYLKISLETDGISSFTDRSDDIVNVDDMELYAVNVDFINSGLNHGLGQNS